MIRRGSLVRDQPDPPSLIGGLAQLGEHLLCKQGVVGSIPSSSTNSLQEGLVGFMWYNFALNTKESLNVAKIFEDFLLLICVD